MSHATAHAAAAAAPPSADVPSWKLLMTLAVAGALAGGLIVFVYRATLPSVEAHRAKILQQAVREVLPGCARWDTLYVAGNTLSKQMPPATGRKPAECVFLGFDAGGNRIGAAITAGEPGFSELVSVIFGLEAESGRLTGMKVLDQKETPGLGDKIEREGFCSQFAHAVAPLTGVKVKTGSENEVQTITGATISSRAVVRTINNAVERWQPLLRAYLQGGTS